MQARCSDSDKRANEIFLEEGKSLLFPKEIPPPMTVLENLALILFRKVIFLQCICARPRARGNT